MNFARLIPATAALAIVFAACGAESPGSDELPDAGPATTVADGGLRAPTPIRVTGGASGDQAVRAEGALAADSSMIAPGYITYEYVVSVDPATLPTNSTGYVFDATVEATASDIAAIAAALGVDGEPVRIDEGYGVHWRVGPEDGTAPSVWLYDDALLGWNHNAGWSDDPIGRGCAVPGSEPAAVEVESTDAEPGAPVATIIDSTDREPDETIVLEPIEPFECDEPEPPANVPDEATAVQLANGYLAALGIDVGGLTYDNYADEWSANVNANEQIGGITVRSWGFTFGAEGELQYAWGSRAVPQPVGPYPLIDLDTAIARLESGRYGFGGYGIGWAEPAIDVAEGDVAVTSEPAESAPEPEVVTVELVSVEADLWWAWDEDGSSWLLPAYRFVSADGGWFTVPAVTDEFLIEEPVDEGIEPAPLPVETLPPETVPGETLPGTPATTLPADSLEPIVGSTLAEFTDAAKAAGFAVRVVEIDGVGQAATADFRLDRINVAIVTVDGVEQVVRATLDDGTLVGEVTVEPTTAPPVGGTEVAIIGIFAGVEFYPACGNEVLSHESGTWYPIQQEYADWWALATETQREELSQAGFAPRVAPPGPGDDVGTLTIWADGIARFVSDSGNISAWLTQTELTYDWVC